MEAFAKLFHPECKVIVNGKHALSGEYIGFDAFNEGNLSKLNNAYSGMGMDIEKVVSNDSDVVVFLKVTYQNSVARAVHHFVVRDELLMEFTSQKLVFLFPVCIDDYLNNSLGSP